MNAKDETNIAEVKPAQLSVDSGGTGALSPRDAETRELVSEIRHDLARKGGSNFVRTVLRGVDPDQKVSRSERATALAIYHKAVVEAGSKDDLFRAFLAGLGFANEQAAKDAARLYAMHSGTTLEQAERDAVKLLKGLMAADPVKRAAYRRDLFGEVAVDAD